MRIVTGMRNTAFVLAFFLASAAPAVAQTSEFGVLIGGSKRLLGHCIDDGVDCRVHLLEPIETALHSFARGDLSRADAVREIRRLPAPEIAVHVLPRRVGKIV